MKRPRRTPSPGFRLPPPFQPITGERATLAQKGIYPYVAMMQIAAEDTEDDYVICRGFDTRIGRYIDYEEGNDDKPGIPVAKPFSDRAAGAFTVGQVFPAILPLYSSKPVPTGVSAAAIGQNPGVSETTAGHPADLDENIEILKTSSEIIINWMLLSGGGTEAWTVRFHIEALTTPSLRIASASIKAVPPGKSLAQVPLISELNLIEICDPRGCTLNETEDDLLGREGYATYILPLDSPICTHTSAHWEVIELCCPLTECT